MKRLGIKVTEEERQRVVVDHHLSGMWTSDGTRFGPAHYAVAILARKYKLPVNTGLDLETGEFVSPNPD